MRFEFSADDRIDGAEPVSPGTSCSTECQLDPESCLPSIT